MHSRPERGGAQRRAQADGGQLSSGRNPELDWSQLREALGLSPRERDVVRLVLAGLKQRAIAAELGLGLGTVKTYAQRIYAKLGVGSQLDLALLVMDAQRQLEREAG